MEALFELEVEWTPIYKPLALNLVSLLMTDRCRDCGRTGGNTEHFCEGSRPPGHFKLCDECASLDPHWGIRCDDREAALERQRERREKYLRTIQQNRSQ
jgi:hypothetical protein